MTPTLLQDCLVKEVKNIISGMLLSNAKNEKASINVYPQYLPSKKSQNDESHFPYILVRVIDGEDSTDELPSICRVVFIIGIYDKDSNYQGYKDIMNIIEKIRQHLLKKRVFNNKYTLEGPVKWAVNEEDIYPLFFGGIETNWNIGQISMEDEEGLI